MNDINSKQVLRFWKTSLIGIICVLTFISSCQAQQTSYRTTTPPDLNDGLKIASAESVGIDKKDLEILTQRISNSDFGYLRSLILIKDGNLIYEGCFFGARRDDRYTIYSVSKTFTSALFGIAMDKGFIKTVDQALLPFFPEYKNMTNDPLKKNIKIHHLLSLSSGFDWDESTFSYEDRRNIHVQMEMTNDWIRFILQRPMRDKPGERWLYNTGNVQLLSAIIKKTTGLYLHEFAEKQLFGPLKIKNYYWNTDPSGYTCAGGSDGGLRLKARDIAKLGCLYTNKGIWNGKRILSEAWIKKSTQGYITTRGDRQYGYLWHVGIDKTYEQPYKFFYHSGSGGHLLMVYPELNLAIVINSGPRSAKPLIRSVLDMIVRN
ncbi:MAG: serine hydrolase [Candidatus Aminicenantes bacterium]|nr:serine hydrolase [Candidatus Aminicenantes bacterium]